MLTKSARRGIDLYTPSPILPSPNCPRSLLPQLHKYPSLSSATVCHSPAATCFMPGKLTRRGVDSLSMLLNPSWPYQLPPQTHTWFCLFKATVCHPPAAIVSIPAKLIRRGGQFFYTFTTYFLKQNAHCNFILSLLFINTPL